MTVFGCRIWLLACLAVPRALFGQVGDSVGLRGLDSLGFVHLQETVNVRREVRVWTAQGRFDLRRPQLDHTGLGFTSRVAAARRDTFPLFDIRVIEVGQTKARLFAVGGAAGLGVLGYYVSQIDFSCLSPIGSSCGRVPRRRVVTVTIASALTGAILGAFIGTHVKGWRVAYTAP